MDNLRTVVGLGAALALSACGGSSTSGTSGGPSFESLSTSGNRLISQYGNAPVTDVSNMPQTSSATYRGVAAYSTDYDDPIDIVEYAETLSQVELNANFATSQINGRAYNFRNFDQNIRIDGQVNMNGTISGNTFFANVSGSTTESGYGESYDVTYNGGVEGAFVGGNAEAVFGYGSALGSVAGIGVFPVWMVFGAER